MAISFKNLREELVSEAVTQAKKSAGGNGFINGSRFGWREIAVATAAVLLLVLGVVVKDVWDKSNSHEALINEYGKYIKRLPETEETLKELRQDIKNARQGKP